MTKNITLCAVPFQVTLADGQVIFLEKSGFYGCHTQFTLEWKGLGWYLVDTDTNMDRIFLPHLVAASMWVVENHTVLWKDGTGIVVPK